jgi:uncharacterized protein (DUF1015 family)
VAEVRPFKGIRYNSQLIKDIGTVICPPHDVIPPRLQDELYHRSEYNFIRIEFGRELPQDTPEDNRYTRAAASMEQWLKQDILKKEDKPVIYIHDYYFTHKGKNYKRRGIIARVRLEEWSKKVIYPHEGTLSKSKNDRLSILWACQANTSPILAMFQDSDRRIIPLLERETAKMPVIETKYFEGEKHAVWAITDPEILNNMSKEMATQPLYIADGHHRYESALLYKHEREACAPSTGEEGYNFIMMTMVEFNDPGLLILPPHRLIRGIPKSTLFQIKSELSTFFDIKEMLLNESNLWSKVDGILTGGLEHVRLGLAGLDNEHLFILELKENTPANNLMPIFHTDIYNKLDVSVVDHIILEKLLGLKVESEQTALTYTYDKQDAVNRVREGEYQLAILLNPIRAEVIKAIADAGDRMPRKSTYFYPKELAGLVFSRFI